MSHRRPTCSSKSSPTRQSWARWPTEQATAACKAREAGQEDRTHYACNTPPPPWQAVECCGSDLQIAQLGLHAAVDHNLIQHDKLLRQENNTW